MDEKKRYAWLELYRERNTTTTYDQLNITEPFNEFFDGVLKIHPSPEIKRMYITSLHLIGFLTIQKRIKMSISRKIKINPSEASILELRAEEIFWCATVNIPKPFMFSALPELTMPGEFYANLEEILYEVIRLKRAGKISHESYSQYKILMGALNNEQIRSRNTFLRDRFTYKILHPVFKLFMRMRRNAIAESYYRGYEMAYFLNLYYKERLHDPTPIALEDIEFLSEKTGGKSGEHTLDEDSTENYERRIIDRKFVLIMHALVGRFMKELDMPRKVEAYAINVLQVFLLKEPFLGYFKDFSAEIVIVGITYIASQVHKKDISVRRIHEIYRSFGFITTFHIREARKLKVSIEEVIQNLIVKTYNILLPCIVKTLKAKSQTLQREESPRMDQSSAKYMLSPLSGRMSQIVPVPTTSKKVLFPEKKVREIM
ncbi:uncharacterized protein NEMAJ01_1069 [Nematocida major]|uniref:uncharacterized protein n=1 Tax=Nematocida major TaxID=1912982 RepID=UPI002007D85B|nr:uncharacterized protein NEMAJ01_1069 [Nematocida major]KAH9386173.1 hypothetical protein NEMAJ01_1069 [Nematocida major]